jgi:multiple sugar transport system substrate-binding protein
VPNSVQLWQEFRDAWSKSVIFGSGNVNDSLATTAKKIDDTIVKK